jgi:hypothetical protein
MDIKSVQQTLSDLGLLDPPADGIWGGVSSWALGIVMGGTVQPEAVTSSAVEAALTAATPLPLTPGDDLAGLMVRGALARGAWICRHPKCYNIIYAEGTNLDGAGNGDPPNQFMAIRTLIQVGSDGVPRFASIPGGGVAKWIATTEPSKYWTENPMDPHGAARLILGQQKAWVMGEYDNAPALKQADELAVQRDPNMTYKRYGPIYRGTHFGIHHHKDYGYPRNDEGRSSAGCCVGWQVDGHLQFMKLLATDARYIASNGYKFSSTILLHADLPALAPGAPPAVAPDVVSLRRMNIWMTVLAGHSQKDGDDTDYSAYTGNQIDPNMVGFSVSFYFDQPRPWVRAFNPTTGKVCEGPLVDVGPGLTHDPWWNDPNGLPGAHSGAGLDATPAAWRALGFDPQDGKARINFELIKPPSPPAGRTAASWTPQG